MIPRIRRSLRPLRGALVAACLAAVVAPSPARADPPAAAPSMREQDVLDRWLKNSPEVAAWRRQVGGARFDVLTARLLPNPELELSVNALAGGAPPDGQFGYVAQVTAPLPVFGQVRARVAAAEKAVGVTETNVMVMLWERASEIQRTMVERAFADARATMLRKNLDELARIQAIVATRAAAGANGPYDVLRVTTSAGTMRAALHNAQVERERAEAVILALVADASLASVDVRREGLAAFRGPQEESALVATALQRRPDLSLAKRGALASGALADRYRREAVPTPSLLLGGYLVQRPYGVQVTAGVSLPLPLFDRNQGAIQRALTEQRGQEQLATALETRIRAEVRGAWRARQAARFALDEFRASSIASATELLRRAEITYQAGAFSIAELFDAYQTLWEARAQELQLELQGAEAEAELERAAVLLPLGTGAPRGD